MLPEDEAKDSLRLYRFERRTSKPLLILAAVFIILVVLPYVVELGPSTISMIDGALLLIWAVFAVEFAIRLYLAPDKLTFLKRNPLDLLAVILPMLRPLRVVRAARGMRLLGLTRAEAAIVRGLRRGRRVFGRHRVVYASLVIALIALAGAFIVNEVERAAGAATITSFPEALWWAVQLVMTVGPSDASPVTLVGRLVAVLLMIVGFGLFGLVAASLASAFIFKGQEHSDRPREQRTDLSGLAERLDRIEAQLAALDPARDTRREEGRAAPDVDQDDERAA